MDVVTVIFGSLKIIFGFFLLLFIPGFAISLVFFPRSAELSLIERLAYSTVLSIGSVIGLVLLMDLVLGIDTTPDNIFIIICVISIVALIIWGCERWYMKSSLKPRIDSLLTIDYLTFHNYYSRLKDFVNTHLERRKNKG
jgi:uncharacterized membrane protein